MKDFADKIRLLRISKNLNQNQLAKIVGISQPFLSDIEKGKRKPSIDVLHKLCDALNCSSDYLLGLHAKSSVLQESDKQSGLSLEALAMLQECNVSDEELKTAMRFTDFLRENK